MAFERKMGSFVILAIFYKTVQRMPLFNFGGSFLHLILRFEKTHIMIIDHLIYKHYEQNCPNLNILLKKFQLYYYPYLRNLMKRRYPSIPRQPDQSQLINFSFQVAAALQEELVLPRIVNRFIQKEANEMSRRRRQAQQQEMMQLKGQLDRLRKAFDGLQRSQLYNNSLLQNLSSQNNIIHRASSIKNRSFGSDNVLESYQGYHSVNQNIGNNSQHVDSEKRQSYGKALSSRLSVGSRLSKQILSQSQQKKDKVLIYAQEIQKQRALARLKKEEMAIKQLRKRELDQNATTTFENKQNSTDQYSQIKKIGKTKRKPEKRIR